MKREKPAKSGIKFGKPQLTMAFVIIVAFIITFLVIASYILKEHKRQISINEKHLIEMTEHNTAIVRNIFNNYVETLRALSYHMSNFDDLESLEAVAFLKNAGEAFGFERLSVVFPDGHSYNKNGLPFEITDEEYLELVRDGKVFISNVTQSLIDGTSIVRIQVPISKHGETIASLSYSMEAKNLCDVIKTDLPNMNGYFCIVDENGNYPAISSTESFSYVVNFFDSLNTLTYGEGYSKQLIEKGFTDSKSGHTEYYIDGALRYGYYAPVGINNWVMLTVIPKEIVMAEINRFISSALLLTLQIALILTAAAVFVYYNQKKMQAEAELDEFCFRLLAEQTGKVVLEWDYAEGIMNYPNFEQTVGRKPVVSSFRTPDEVVDAGAVHPDDSEAFKSVFYDIANGLSVELPKVRLWTVGKDYMYYSISSTVIFDAKGRPYKSIGFMENIDDLVRREERLRQRAEIDQLTGLYNKSAAERAITETIAVSDKDMLHALICADLDYFKSINDEFGHLYGDKVLIELATGIRKVFRKDDIMCRFGGDEFVMFIRDIPSREFIETKAIELNKRMNRTYTKDGITRTVSASIGIALFPADGRTYKELYERADEASYVVKNSGKNSYRFAAEGKGEESGV